MSNNPNTAKIQAALQIAIPNALGGCKALRVCPDRKISLGHPGVKLSENPRPESKA